jgi:uncharacterized DUF497 family protein
MELEFEWNEAKAEANLRAHGVSFEFATKVFRDAFAIERLDDREDYGEERFVIRRYGRRTRPPVCGLCRTRGPYSNHFSPEGNAG